MKPSTPLLSIKNLYACIEEKKILHGVSLAMEKSSVHAIMGPNGGGKSTLAQVLMGKGEYDTKNGSKEKSSIHLNGEDILSLSTYERARKGIFLAFQSPMAIPGVSVMNILRTSYESLYPNTDSKNISSHNPLLTNRWQGSGMTLPEFIKKVKQYAASLSLDESLLTRGIHDGFSGGERKKIEMLQALVLKPKLAIFDEIDTGLDVDALKTVAFAIKMLKENGTAVLIITHYQRILRYVKPDFVHVFIDGKIVQTGDTHLALTIEQEGYSAYADHSSRV